jgi:subfamily B ATP-binding cassette protein MsbA
MRSASPPSPTRRLFAYFRPDRRRLVLGLLATVIANVCAMAMIWMVRDVIRPIAPARGVEQVAEDRPQSAMQRLFGESKPLPGGEEPAGNGALLVLFACLKILGIGVVRALFAFVGFYYTNYAALHAIRRLRNEMYRHLQSLSVSFFDRERTGHLMSRIISDTALVQTIFVGEIINMVATPVAAALGLGLMLKLNWQLTLVSMVVFPLAAYAVTKAGRKIRLLTLQLQGKIAELSSVLQEAVSGIRTVKALGTEAFETQKFAGKTAETTRFALRSARVQALLHPLVELVAVFGFVAALWFGGSEVIRGRMEPADLITFALFIQRLGTNANQLSSMNIVLQQLSAAAQRIFEFLGRKPEVVEKEDALVLDAARGEVSFEHLSFSYDGREEVLDDVSFVLSPGERLALVGPSGTGKTTVASLILRLYDRYSGAIKIDGHNLRDIALVSVRNAIALVPQEPILFTGTVADNIAYGRFDAPREEIMAAAMAANAHEFITALPEGYDTPVGERGVSLSGGQRQRIVIARAILRNPRILILDEATSSLDAQSEAAVQEALENLMRGRSTLIIAHRLSTVRNADRILVLHEGKIVESGTHDRLMALDGVYKRLYTIQEKGYQNG